MIPRPFYLGLGLVLAVVVTGIAAQRLHDDPEHAAPPLPERPTAGVTAPPPLAATGGDSTAALEVQYVTFIEGVQREAERVAAEEAQRLAATRSTPSQRVAGGRAGPASCDGIDWVIPVQLVIRESGCNFDAQSPSSYCGGYGCVGAYQFDARHWDPSSGWGGCADLGDWHDPDAQHECARRLSRDGTSLSPWGG